MKYLFLLVLCITSALAQTNIEETRFHFARWTKDGSPYRVYNTVTIDSLLVIEPGVRVEFVSKRDGSHAGIRTDSLGRIYAVGTESDSIVFTSYWDDYGWGQIGSKGSGKFQNIFKYCVFENSDYGIRPSSVDAVNLDTVEHCAFRNNEYCFHIMQSIYVSHCEFANNNSCFYFEAYDDSFPQILFIESCGLHGNIEAILIAGRAANAVIRNCAITDNYTGVDIALGKDITIGGAPEYCNRIYNNVGWDGLEYNLTRSGKYGFLDARYNYWGSTDRDTVSKSIWIQYPDSASWLPFNDENCIPIPLAIDRPFAPAVSGLTTSPNPVFAGVPVTLTYSLQTASTLTLKVQDILGRAVREEFLGRTQPGGHTRTVSTAGLKPGMYFYSLLPGDGRANTGWIIVR